LNQVAVRFRSAQDLAAPADTAAFLWASSHRNGDSGRLGAAAVSVDGDNYGERRVTQVAVVLEREEDC